MAEPPTPARSVSAPLGEASARAAAEAEEVRAAAARVAEASAGIQERLQETERLVARARAAHIALDREHVETERLVHGAEELTDAAHLRVGHGRRVIGAKGPDEPAGGLDGRPPSGEHNAPSDGEAPP